jgi:hypothetical protein
MPRTVTRDDVLGGDATVAIGGGDMPGGPQPYGAGCAVPRRVQGPLQSPCATSVHVGAAC